MKHNYTMRRKLLAPMPSASSGPVVVGLALLTDISMCCDAEISLCFNTIKQSGAQAIAEAIAARTRRLSKLSLNGNSFSEEGIMALDKTLQPHGVSLDSMSDNDEDDASESDEE
eukprot:COSAG05_NODE_11509_length_510_cov_0.854015_1_plen_114_part_00